MTLHDKAEFFQAQVRSRHIRHGFNATLGYMRPGDISSGSLEDSDNDGLWTSMYMGAEVFRYAVTKSEDALQNLRESMEAMERLYTINGVKGFPSRSFERRGYKYDDKPWRRAEHPEWDWKSTTSSDEAIGHMFIFGAMAELLDDEDLKNRAIVLMDSLMQHVIDHDMYLVDWDGKPTVWGRCPAPSTQEEGGSREERGRRRLSGGSGESSYVNHQCVSLSIQFNLVVTRPFNPFGVE